MLPHYEVKINELEASSQELAKNSEKKAEREKFLNETQTLQNDFSELKLAVEAAQSKWELWLYHSYILVFMFWLPQPLHQAQNEPRSIVTWDKSWFLREQRLKVPPLSYLACRLV